MLLIALIDKFVPSFENPHEAHDVQEMDDDAAAAYRRALRAGGLPSSAEAYARGRLAELE